MMGSAKSKYPPFPVTTLFKQEEPIQHGKKQVTYRIPALIYIKESQLYLAFAEKRLTADDTDADALVMRAGLWKNAGVEWDEHHQLLSSASLPNHRSMNPCPVYERESKIIFLFFICVPIGISESKQIQKRKNQARLCYIKSDNNGKTWSSITDLMADVVGEEENNWATFAVGPGHGIQMQSGRLVIPAYAYLCHSYHKPTPHAFAFYSVDKGLTWHMGGRVERESGECEIAEIIDDQGNSFLYCNARSKSGHRVEAVSGNGGEVFDKPSPAHKLTETGLYGCQGSILSLASRSRWLLYSHPANPHKRRSLGVSLNRSPLDPSKWDEHKLIIYDGPSGYSDLAECGDGEHVACLMECGQISEVETIGFVIFKVCSVIESKGDE